VRSLKNQPETCMKNLNYLHLHVGAALLVLLSLLYVPTAHAAGSEYLRCAKQYRYNDAERLKCYERINAIKAQSASETPPVVPTAAIDVIESPLATVPIDQAGPIFTRSYLTRAWNLDDLNSRDDSRMGRLQPHKLNYLIARKSSVVNQQPHSPGIGSNTTTPNDFDEAEVKYQLSVKADIGSQKDIDWYGLKTFRLWGTYTQQSSWQLFNTRNSSPFRETNYEPELIATFGTTNQTGLRLVNLGWSHQSNGRTQPESRSWNRIYLQGGWEWNDRVSFLGRAWWRITENPLKDDNPDITDHAGRADMLIRWEPGDKSQAISLLLRNNLNRTNNRGFLQLDWALPENAGDSSRVHLQYTSGYGESLIDYNHRQNTIGLGFSFREW
jgi:phospholipase A1